MYTSADQITSTRRQSTSGKKSRFFTHRKPQDSEVCLNGTTVLFIFFCSRWGHLLIPGWLSQFLGSLCLLLGDLLLRHDGHPWWYWPGDRLLGYVVVVNEGKEAPATPRALRGEVAIHPSRHAVTLLLQRERENKIENTNRRQCQKKRKTAHAEKETDSHMKKMVKWQWPNRAVLFSTIATVSWNRIRLEQKKSQHSLNPLPQDLKQDCVTFDELWDNAKCYATGVGSHRSANSMITQ